MGAAQHKNGPQSGGVAFQPVAKLPPAKRFSLIPKSSKPKPTAMAPRYSLALSVCNAEGNLISPNEVTVNFEEDDFAESEVMLLKDSFERIMKRREEIASAIRQRIGEIPGSTERFEKFRKTQKPENASASADMAMFLLRGIERFVLRLGNRTTLKGYCAKLKLKHRTLYGVDGDMMLMAMGQCQGIFMSDLERQHAHTDVDENSIQTKESPGTPTSHAGFSYCDSCETCRVWRRFFDDVLKVLAFSQ